MRIQPSLTNTTPTFDTIIRILVQLSLPSVQISQPQASSPNPKPAVQIPSQLHISSSKSQASFTSRRPNPKPASQTVGWAIAYLKRRSLFIEPSQPQPMQLADMNPEMTQDSRPMHRIRPASYLVSK